MVSGCVFLAVERDTRSVELTDAQRVSFYPASPLPLVSWVFHGRLHAVEHAPDRGEFRVSDPSPRLAFIGPFRKPAATWSPGALHALWVSFYPEALFRLWGIRAEDYIDTIVPLEGLIPDDAFEALSRIGRHDESPWQALESLLQPLCEGCGLAGTSNLDLRSWITSLAPRVAAPSTLAGVRRMQRRIRAVAGQSRRDLQVFSRVEEVFSGARIGAGETESLADVAANAGYSDQSHMGRELKRVTGLSPKRLGERARVEESFWIYRLLGDHFRELAGR